MFKGVGYKNKLREKQKGKIILKRWQMAALIKEKKLEQIAETEVKIGVQMFHKLVELEMLKEDDRIELINGKMYEMSPIGLKHMAVVDKLGMLFGKSADKKFIIRIQGGIKLSEYSELYPDITLLKFREDFYINTYPNPESDVFLIIEVSDTSLNYDKYKKLPLYAESKVPEVWIINLQECIIEVYEKPDIEKKEYTVMKKVRIGEIKPLKLEYLKLKVDEIFME